MIKKRGFVLFHEYKEQFLALSDYESGKLIKAIFEYATTGEIRKLPPKSSVAFAFIKNALDENEKKYEEVLKLRSEAGKKSGKIRRQKSLEANKTNISSFCLTKQTDTDTVTETETETATDTVTDTETKKKENNTHSLTQKARGEFENVFLSDESHAALEREYGADIAAEAVELLSRRIARTGNYKSENHLATIKDWVIAAVYEQRQKQAAISKSQNRERDEKLERAKKSGFDFELDEIFEIP